MGWSIHTIGYNCKANVRVTIDTTLLIYHIHSHEATTRCMQAVSPWMTVKKEILQICLSFTCCAWCAILKQKSLLGILSVMICTLFLLSLTPVYYILTTILPLTHLSHTHVQCSHNLASFDSFLSHLCTFSHVYSTMTHSSPISEYIYRTSYSL